MVSTRSASGLPPLPQQTAAAASRSKRKAAPEPSTAQKKVRPNELETNTTLLAAVLSFDFEEAKQHLINADARFEDLFSKMPCKPFVHLEQVHPFRWVVGIDVFAILET
jgi:DNA-3-methyladenine glycosylase II